MSITEKIANAKETTWVTEALSEAEVKSTVELAKISARIEKCRQNMNMTQIPKHIKDMHETNYKQIILQKNLLQQKI